MQIGKYRVVKQLGAGAMGVVYLAEHPTLSQRVAIKLINAKLVHREGLGERFINEARAASQIGHPGIIGIHDFDTDPGTGAPFIVMELLEGQDLGDYLAGVGRASPAFIRDVGMQIADALAAAHDKRIIHRDLKPDNVFLCPDAAVIGGTRAKILDFGIAKLADATQLTRGGSLMGTPMYMSPEQTTGAEKVDERSDIYSLGCMLYQMATGQVPYPEAQTLDELFECHRSRALPPATARAPQLPEPLSQLIAACVAKDPERRPQTMGEVRARLAEAVPGAGAEAGAGAETAAGTGAATGAGAGAEAETADAVPVAAAVPVAGRGPMVWAIAGLSVVGVGVAVVVALQGGEPGSGVADAGPAAAAPDAAPRQRNRWIRVEVPDEPVALTVPPDVPAELIQGREPMTSPARSYEIHRREVTLGELVPWFLQSPFKHERLPNLLDWKGGPMPLRFRNHPAVGVTFAMASAYCESLGGRLPTSAEWEWAARGAALRPEPWGEGAREISVLDESLRFPDVSSSRADRTPEGVYDLAGSVLELTADTFPDPGDALGRRVVVRGADPQFDTGRSRRFSAIQQTSACADGPCASTREAFTLRGITGFRCVR